MHLVVQERVERMDKSEQSTTLSSHSDKCKSPLGFGSMNLSDNELKDKKESF